MGKDLKGKELGIGVENLLNMLSYYICEYNQNNVLNSYYVYQATPYDIETIGH